MGVARSSTESGVNSTLHTQKKMIRIFLFSSLLTVGIIEFQLRLAKAEGIWNPTDTPKADPSHVIWETTTPDSVKQGKTPIKWEDIPEPKGPNKPQSSVVWEEIETENDEFIPPSEKKSNWKLIQPMNLEEAEALLGLIPLQSSDF